MRINFIKVRSTNGISIYVNINEIESIVDYNGLLLLYTKSGNKYIVEKEYIEYSRCSDNILCLNN